MKEGWSLRVRKRGLFSTAMGVGLRSDPIYREVHDTKKAAMEAVHYFARRMNEIRTQGIIINGRDWMDRT